MEDRFKFRIFDKTKNVMVYFDSIFGNKRPYTETSSFVQYESCPQFHKISEPMQCTGLKDKNGKLEYKDDILLTPNETICFIVNDGFRWAVKSPGSNAVDYEDSKFFEQCEIIGNIYENPELLGGEE